MFLNLVNAIKIPDLRGLGEYTKRVKDSDRQIVGGSLALNQLIISFAKSFVENHKNQAAAAAVAGIAPRLPDPGNHRSASWCRVKPSDAHQCSLWDQINSSLNNRPISELKARGHRKTNDEPHPHSPADSIRTLGHALHVLRVKLGSPNRLEMAGRRVERERQQMQQPHGLGHPQELAVELRPGVFSGQHVAALLHVPEQRLLHLGVHHREEFLEAEVAETAGGQNPQKLDGV
nr:hypothetical protein Iba_chr07bCG3310 [Ipomoea batatas]